MMTVTYIGSTTVTAHSDFWLVGVDVDLGVASRAATAIARNDAVVRPPDRLLMDEFYGSVRLWLDSARVNFLFPVQLPRPLRVATSWVESYLEVKVRLLESRSCHSLRSRTLAPRPHIGAVWSLKDLFRGHAGGDLRGGICRHCGRFGLGTGVRVGGLDL